MTTTNPFDILEDDDNDDPTQLAASLKPKIVQPKIVPSKPPPPVKEERRDNFRGRGQDSRRGYVQGRGSGHGRSFGPRNNEFSNNENLLENNNWFSQENKQNEVGDTVTYFENRGYGGDRDQFSGGWSSGLSKGGFVETERPQQTFERRSGTERPHRTFERRSGFGQRNEYRSQGDGGDNWGVSSEEINQDAGEFVIESKNNQISEQSVVAEVIVDANQENTAAIQEEKVVEAKEMTLEEYEKVVEEKRKALEALKTEKRIVDVDKDFQSMHQLSNKKDTHNVFVKLGSMKEKRNEISEKGEKVKKAVSINEFLKPNEGWIPSYRGGGRGRGGRGRGRGGGSGPDMPESEGYVNPPYVAPSPSIADHVEFPSLN